MVYLTRVAHRVRKTRCCKIDGVTIVLPQITFLFIRPRPMTKSVCLSVCRRSSCKRNKIQGECRI